MAKITHYEGKLPKRLDGNRLVYPLGEDIIMRLNSGFTSKALKESEVYENSRKNSSEFGRISSSDKGIRMALEGVLPTQNNLSIVNSLNKRMRSLLPYDTTHVRGERVLETAFEDAEAIRLLRGYCFNPHATLQVSTALVDGHLAISSLALPEGISWVGFRLHVVKYDWEGISGKLFSGGWHFEQEVAEVLKYSFPKVESGSASLIFVLEVQPFAEQDGAFVPVRTAEKAVVVVDYVGKT